MFYKIYKSFASLFTAATVIIMGSVFVSEKNLPDNFYISSGSSLSLPARYANLFSAEKDSSAFEPVISACEASYSAKIKLFGLVPVKSVSVSVSDEKTLIVCGSPFGVKMFTDGVLVVNFSEIETKSGKCCPASEAGLEKGDVIKKVNGKEVFTNEDVADFIKNSDGNAVEISVLRGGSEIGLTILPKMLSDESGYKAGFWVRDSSAGIGTLTFYDPDTKAFGGLGHAVCDIDTGGIIPFSSGKIVPAAITKINKGVAGAPGELGGTFVGDDMGTVKINNETGLYGTLDYEVDGFPAAIAHKQDVYEGAAVIYSTLDGMETAEYDIEIEQINLSDDSVTKNMIIRVTDEDLLELSGGIVQGMSGSPILQDGKLVGAVTHVFVNDPTKGFGIFIENMLEKSENCK